MAGSSRAGVILQARDRKLLQELEHLRVVDRVQAMRVGPWGSVPRANARLLALTRGGFLERHFIPSGDFGRKAVYSLPGRRGRSGFPGKLFVEHQLSINRIYLDLAYPRTSLPARLLTWQTFQKPVSPTSALIPDAYFDLIEGGHVNPFFLESDLGTETSPVFQRKAALYVQLAISGAFAERFGHERFRVLVVTPSDARVEQLRAAVRGITDKLFWFAAAGAVEEHGMLGPVWSRASTPDHPISLFRDTGR